MSIVDTATLDRLEHLLDRYEALQRLLPPEITALATTDTDGNPSNVAAGELIESAWGNAVTDHVVKRFALGSRLPATKPIGQLVINTEPVVGRVPLVDMAFNNAWNVIYPRTAAEFQGSVTLTGTINTGAESQLGTISVPQQPYNRLAMVTCGAYSNGPSPPVTSSIWELRVKQNGTLVTRAQGVVGLSVTAPPVLFQLALNTAYTFTVHGIITQGTGPWTVLNDGTMCRLDVLAWY